MKKAITTFLTVCAALCLGAWEVPVDNAWKCYHAKPAKLKAGVFTGTPKDAGASLVRFNLAVPEPNDFNRCIVVLSGRDASALNLSLRGTKHLHIKAVKGSAPDEYFFDFDALPEQFKEMRIYYNVKDPDGGKPVTFTLKSVDFVHRKAEAKAKAVDNSPLLSFLPMPKRQRVADHTAVFPRIQSKYDLCKNYLGGYSLGSGTFFDRPLFFDRSLLPDPIPVYDKLNTPRGFVRQIGSARDFADGFAIFIADRKARFLLPLEYCDAAGIKNAILVETPPTRLENFDNATLQFDRALASPSTFKINGSLVVGSYHGTVFSPEKWKEVLKPYRAKYGNKILFMCEMRSLCYRINTAYKKNNGKISQAQIEKWKKEVRRYLDVVDGVNFSGSNHLTVPKAGYPEGVFCAEAYERFIVPLVTSVLAEPKYNGKKLLGLSAHKVYCPVRNPDDSVDEEGTFGLRSSFGTALAANPDYILMPEWNETNENTHVEPVVSDAQTNRRVMEAMRGREIPEVEKRYPNFILSFRQVNEYGAAIPVELLGLPDKEGKPYAVTLKLLAPDGKVLYTFPKAEFDHKSITPVMHLIPAKDFAAFRYIVPELTVEQNGKTTVLKRGLPIMRFVSAPNILRRYVKIPLRDLPDPEKITSAFSFADGKVTVSGKVETPEKIVSIELLADDIPLDAVDFRDEYKAPEGMVMLCWRRSCSAGITGLNHDTVTVTAKEGKIQVRPIQLYCMAGMETPKQQGNTITGNIGGGGCIREFWFFATPDAVLEISERKQGTTVKVADVLKNGYFRYSANCGVAWQLISRHHQVEMPYPLDVNKAEYNLAASTKTWKGAVYSLRVVTRAGRVFRSEAVTEKPVGTEKVDMPVWDLLTNRREVISVPHDLAREVRFEFDPRLGDALPNSSGIREWDAVIGSFDYRTHSEPGWAVLHAPKWQKTAEGYTLKFVKGDGLQLCQPLFSSAAFTLDMTLSLDDLADQTLVDTIRNAMQITVVNGVLQGKLTTRLGKYAWKSDVKLEANRFYRFVFRYDLEKFTATVDGKVAAEIPAKGRFGNSWVMSIGGAPVKAKKEGVCFLNKNEEAHDIPNPGFNLSGTLKALSIRNY